jgi:hypothetical protein
MTASGRAPDGLGSFGLHASRPGHVGRFWSLLCRDSDTPIAQEQQLGQAGWATRARKQLDTSIVFHARIHHKPLPDQRRAIARSDAASCPTMSLPASKEERNACSSIAAAALLVHNDIATHIPRCSVGPRHAVAASC